jgi:hypothetical protein
MAKYFEKKDYTVKASYDDIDFTLYVTDNYNESAVEETIRETGQAELLQVAALQMAIIGIGNSNYGSVLYKGEPFNLEETFKKLGVKIGLAQNSKLQPGDLTPRRLQRFFRHGIADWINKNPDQGSYLYKKYSDHDTKMRHVCFPGAEHLIKDKEEAAYILQTYHNLDRQQNTSIMDRVKRVLMARGVYTYKEAETLVEKISKMTHNTQN